MKVPSKQSSDDTDILYNNSREIYLVWSVSLDSCLPSAYIACVGGDMAQRSFLPKDAARHSCLSANITHAYLGGRTYSTSLNILQELSTS